MDEIQKAINKIDEYFEIMYKDFGEGMKELPKIVGCVQSITMKFLKDIEYYNENGENIQITVTLNQLKKLLDAIDLKDQLLIADILEYEIKQNFIVYKELVNKYGK